MENLSFIFEHNSKRQRETSTDTLLQYICNAYNLQGTLFQVQNYLQIAFGFTKQQINSINFNS